VLSPLLESEQMSSGNFVNKNHGVGLNQHHLEWCPKYRYSCMRRPEFAAEMEKILREIAERHQIHVVELAVMPDHIHMFVSLQFSMSVSRALQLLKGGSAYQFFRLHPNFRLRYPKGHFWSPGHFSRSVSNVSASTIVNYIRNQECGELGASIKSADEEARQMCITDF